jgi:3-hydroxyacyl-CoA dehydrogenase / enoyl-CoA hydratase / 3-hydroxybutyryl-CoA epimerase
MEKKKYHHWKLETDDDNIVWCYIDVKDSSSNVLSSEVLDEFSDVIDTVSALAPAGMIITSGKEKGFIAGADIKEFTTIEDEKDALTLLNRGHDAFSKLEALSFPTLALIKGFCLGGGLELALACDYRIALDDKNTRIGLPEVMLGIHPGFGGSVRLIRLIGPVMGMQLMLQGRTLEARKAKSLGVVDYIVPERQFMKSGPINILRKPQPKRAPRHLNILNKSPFRQLLAKYLRHQLAKKIKQSHYPAPYKLVDVWEKYGDNEKAMLKAEALSVAKLANNKSSRNLVRVFLLQERLKENKQSNGFEPENVHVIGAGVMGGDIAAWCALQGMQVGLQDREPKFIAPAIQRASKLYKRKLKHPRLVRGVMDRLLPDLNGYNLNKADVVIEAIVENAEIKKELFQDLESKLKDETILATNTSSISLEMLTDGLKDPARLVGIHFFNPVSRMQLVEIIYSAQTGKEWIERAQSFCCQIGRLPLPVKSSPGFLVNRILTPYLMEAMVLHEEGISAETIDKVAVDFGLPMGPVELADTVGLDICLSVAKNLTEKLELNIPQKLEDMVAKGMLGKKSGSGFYLYKKGKPQKQTSQSSGIQLREIEDRLVLRILNECAACLREELVADADMLDAGMIFGTGFPPFLGGPLNYARSRGVNEISNRLDELKEKYGQRFTPDAHWEKLVEDT